jgi:hypothetical protein
MTIDGVAQMLLLRGNIVRITTGERHSFMSACRINAARPDPIGRADWKVHGTQQPVPRAKARHDAKSHWRAIELTVRKDLKFSIPRADTPTHFVTMGLNEDLDEAARMATREMVAYLSESYKLTPDDAYMLSSKVVDLHVMQTWTTSKASTPWCRRASSAQGNRQRTSEAASLRAPSIHVAPWPPSDRAPRSPRWTGLTSVHVRLTNGRHTA